MLWCRLNKTLYIVFSKLEIISCVFLPLKGVLKRVPFARDRQEDISKKERKKRCLTGNLK